MLPVVFAAFKTMNQIPGIYIRQSLLLLLIAMIFSVLFWNLRFFLPALLGAYTLYVLLRDVLFFLTGRWKWPIKLAATVLLLLSFIAILLPLNWVFSLLHGRLSVNNGERKWRLHLDGCMWSILKACCWVDHPCASLICYCSVRLHCGDL